MSSKIFKRQMSNISKDLIKQASTLVFIEDILLTSGFKSYMLQLIKQIPEIRSEKILKLSCEKSFFMLITVKHLGQEIGFNTTKPIDPK